LKRVQRETACPERTGPVRQPGREFKGSRRNFLGRPPSDASKYKNFGDGAQVSGIDAADGLLAIARTRTPAGDCRRGDLEELPFPDECLDLVTGFNSIQYAGNPVVALREARRVARVDATVVVVTWGDPENMDAAAVVAALRPFMPPPPPGAPGPFALSDEAALRQFAAAAGLKPVEVFDVDSPFA
jgi:SAM-dependent methyltransferase